MKAWSILFNRGGWVHNENVNLKEELRMYKWHELEVTQEEFEQLILNVLNASVPVGMGFLSYQAREYDMAYLKKNFEDAFEEIVKIDWQISFDYFEGRMVKTGFVKEWPGKYYITRSDPLDVEYQSWALKYPTIQDLLNSLEN